MPAPKKKPAAKKPAPRPTLAEIGREAAKTAQRKALFAELVRQKWNLAATAVALGVGGSANVIRAIHSLGLDEEYKAARIKKLEAS